MAEILTYEQFLTQVASFLGVESTEIRSESHIYNDLGIDSLGIFSLGMFLMERYGIAVPLSEVSSIATIGDMYNTLDRHRLA